MILMSVC